MKGENMENNKVEIKTIEEYILQFPKEKQEKLNQIKEIIRQVVPKETTEKISWGMPTFYLNGNLVHFAGQKNHIGFYPGASGVENFKQELTEYKNSKGAIQFDYEKQLPKELIQRIVKFRVEENTK
jgi:uncharacterized protein YdhG (YjbR/CyaY superfamily)